MPPSRVPTTAYHPLEVLTRRGVSQEEIAQRLGITAEEVGKVRRQLRYLNWAIVGAAYELVREGGKPRFDQELKERIRDAVARKLELPGGNVEV
jgi:transcriptional regulator with XRE-family HTH domain